MTPVSDRYSNGTSGETSKHLLCDSDHQWRPLLCSMLFYDRKPCKLHFSKYRTLVAGMSLCDHGTIARLCKPGIQPSKLLPLQFPGRKTLQAAMLSAAQRRQNVYRQALGVLHFKSSWEEQTALSDNLLNHPFLASHAWGAAWAWDSQAVCGPALILMLRRHVSVWQNRDQLYFASTTFVVIWYSG